MASAGNPNQPAAFDMNNLFRPSPSPNPNSSPVNSPAPPAPFPPPSSFPLSSGPYSYPPQSGPAFHHHPYLHYPPPEPAAPRPIISYPAPAPGPPPSANPNPGARLMALLGTSSSPNLDHASSAPPPPPEYSVPAPNASILPAPIPSAPPVPPQPAPSRLPSSKLPKGRHLHGDHVVYDIDDRQPGELQPQLEVTPITKYVSDPGLVIGRQIAVNRTYICYGLKLGAIRVLNINTALRSLLRGHTQRVTDMAFFADDVHLLASASIDGRIYVWKINEGPDEEDKPQITGKVIVAIQISDGESFHPRVCWHSHKQEILVVGIAKHVLKIDTTKVGKGEILSAEEPIKCHLDKLIDGVQLVGKHEGEVTDLSICQWMTSRLASASADGTVIIWEERKAVPLVTLRPHDGQPVNSAMFLTSPHRPDQIVLITAGHLNREVKLWASASEEGWLLPSDAESWKCIQTLELKSSADFRPEAAFFNQVVVLPRAGLILLANAKKNAIYAVHVDYGACPVATHMDYLAEFTVTMPILSLTGTSDCISEGLHIVQVYCVQTQAIQQYALDLSQCLPPPLDPEVELNHFLNGSQEFFSPLGLHHESSKPPVEMPAAPRLPVTVSSVGPEHSSVEVAAISVESKQPSATIDVDSVHVGSSSPLPLSPRLSGRLSGMRSPSNGFEQSQPLSEHSILERRVDAIHTNVSDVSSLDDGSREGEANVGQNDISVVSSPPITFRHPTHLVTPSEILSASASSSERKDAQETIVNKDVDSVELEVKVVGEAEVSQPGVNEAVHEEKEKPIYTQASNSDAEATRECCALPSEIVSLEGSCQPEDVGIATEACGSPSIAPLEGQESGKDAEGKVLDSAPQAESSQSAMAVKGKKQKNKAIPTSASSSPCLTDLTTDPGLGSAPIVTISSQILALQETLNQVMTMQKEMQKQMTAVVAVPVNKEGRRLETALGRSMEKAVKANVDAMWARLQEENAKHEKLERERVQQITNLITNCMNKDLPAILEKVLKKELSTVVPNITRSITPVLEKAISSAIADSFQRGVGDKAVGQLEKSVSSKLEATVARQVQVQFQTSGKQALQESLRASLESSVIPAFEISCKAMFEQVDATFRKGMSEHTSASQQQFESTHSSLATTLRDALNSATTMTQTLTGELADGQRKFLALVAAGANQNAANPLATQSSNGALAGLHDMTIFPQVEAPLDPTKELQRLISERKIGDAFTVALQRSDVSIVSWLCSQVDLQGILAAVPSQLGQGVILSLLQQLACDLGNDTARKLEWMRDVAIAINPVDPTIAIHVRPIFDQVYQILAHHQRTHPTITPAEANSLRVLMHVINSVLLSCK